MKKILFSAIIALAFVHDTYGQTKSGKREIYNKDFKWTIAIPENFENVDAEEWTRLQKRGKEAIEKTYDAKVEDITKTIFVFKSDQLNYFESNYQAFDSITDGNFLEVSKAVNAMLYGTFEAQMPGAKLDSASYAEVISGLTFQVFAMAITLPNNMVLNCRMYTRLFDKKQFTINIMTVDKAKEELLLDTWRKSRFN